MQADFPRVERWLLAGQAVGAVAVAAAWGRSSAEGWPSIGFALALLGLAVGLAAFQALGKSFRIAPSPRPDAALVRHGVYRWLRHPMYVSVLLVIAGAACSRPSTAVLLAAGTNLVLYVVKARYEERVLLHHYEEYAAYRTGTVGVSPLAENAESGMKSGRSRNQPTEKRE